MTNKNYIIALMIELIQHTENDSIPKTYIKDQLEYITKQIATNL